MKSKLKSVAILLFIIIFTMHTSSYIPDKQLVEVMTFSDAAKYESIDIGVPVNISLVIKNYTNNTISNITLFQEYSKEINIDKIQLLKSPIGDFNGTYINYTRTEITNLSTTNLIDNTNLPINYFNVTKTNFTLNFPNMSNYTEVAIGFTLNFTAEGLFTFPSAKVTYFDHWGDKYTKLSSNEISVTVKEKTNNPIREYIPQFNVSNINYKFIGILTFGTLLIAIFSRVLYFKKPLML